MRSLVSGCTAVALASAAIAQSPETRWQFSTASGGRMVAAIHTPGPLRGISAACEGSSPMILVGAPALPGRATAVITLTGMINARPVMVPVTWTPRGGGGWWALLKDRAALDLLTDGSTEVAIAISGRPLGSVSLTGSNEALRSALRNCHQFGQATPIANAGASRNAQEAQNSLPLRFGTYAPAGVRCGAFENRQVFIDSGQGGAGGPDAIGAIESLRKTGPTSYAVREDVGIQDNSVVPVTYTIPNRETFTVRVAGEPARSYRHCPLESLPLDQQRWPQAEHKRVVMLPIEPGYYQIGQLGATARQLECEQGCGFALFGPAGVAFVEWSDYAPDLRRTTLRKPLITQIAAQTFRIEPAGGDEEQARYLYVRSPTDITEPGDVDGEPVPYTSIPAAEVPARVRPRL